jgi:hypothetical protein
LCIKDDQLIHVKSLKTSQKNEDQIKIHFKTTNIVNKNYLTRKVYTLKMDDQEIVQVYFDRFNNVLDELNLLLEEETKRNAEFLQRRY